MRTRSLCVVMVAVLAVVLCGAMRAQAALTWNVENDFSAVNNPNGAWSYGSYTGGTFSAFTTHETLSNGFVQWHGSASDPHIMQNPTGSTGSIYNITLAPGAISLGPYTGLADIRWTAPSAGTYNVNSVFTVAQTTGAYGPVAVYQNGSQVASFTTSDSGQTFAWANSALTLAAGNTLDFVVGDAAGMTRDVRLQATISSVPEPSTLVIGCTGLSGLVAYAWRKRR